MIELAVPWPAPAPGQVRGTRRWGVEHLPHLFERFYRVDTARDRGHGGSGIGPAVVKALVEAHGGTAGVDGDGPGQGTTFTIDLPPAASPGR